MCLASQLNTLRGLRVSGGWPLAAAGAAADRVSCVVPALLAAPVALWAAQGAACERYELEYHAGQALETGILMSCSCAPVPVQVFLDSLPLRVRAARLLAMPHAACCAASRLCSGHILALSALCH